MDVKTKIVFDQRCISSRGAISSSGLPCTWPHTVNDNSALNGSCHKAASRGKIILPLFCSCWAFSKHSILVGLSPKVSSCTRGGYSASVPNKSHEVWLSRSDGMDQTSRMALYPATVSESVPRVPLGTGSTSRAGGSPQICDFFYLVLIRPLPSNSPFMTPLIWSSTSLVQSFHYLRSPYTVKTKNPFWRKLYLF